MPFQVGERVEYGVECGSIGIKCHMHNISMTCKMSRGCSSKHGLHGGSQRVTFDKYAIGEVNNEWADECSMKFGSSKGDKVIDRCPGIYLSEPDTATTNVAYQRTKAERKLKGSF
jgi:hypothetical protein